MKKFEVIKNTLEANRFNFTHYEQGCTLDKVTIYPETIKSFDTIEDAREELKKHSCYVDVVESYTYPLFYVTEHYIEENEYDEDGDFVQMIDIWEFARLDYDRTQEEKENL